jgi:hypothetical protein
VYAWYLIRRCWRPSSVRFYLPEALFRRVFFAALLVLGAYIVAGAFDGYS